MEYDFLVVGAGLFGAVFAYEMKHKGIKCLVIDKRDHIGGNLYTEEMNGITVHRYGAHIFHTNNGRVWKYINRFTSFNSFINSPLAVYKDELYNLPFNMNTFAKMWGITTPSEAKEIIDSQVEKARQFFVNPEGEPSNLEEQAISMVGIDVYEKLVKGYTEKQWGRDCSELPKSIIKRIPLRFIYNNNYFDDKYQGIPEEGYTAIIAQLLEGTDVITGIDYKSFVNQQSEKTSGRITWRKVLYTGMIDEFFDYCFGPLEYRSLRFETEVMKDVDNYQGNAVVNYTDLEVPYTRVIEHKHFDRTPVLEPGTGTVVTKEYPQEWKPGLEPYYPVNDEVNNALYKKYRKLADESDNVIFGGRLGTYKYYNMDKIIEEALNLAAVINY